MPVGGANAVRTGIAAADHHDMLALGADRAPGRGPRLVVAGDAPVLRHQEVHRVVDAAELATRDLQIARPFRAAGQRHRVIAFEQRLHRQRGADLDAGAELDTLGLHLAHAAVDQVLFHLEVGNAIAQQPARPVGLLEQRDAMARPRELLGAGKARWTRADHRYALAGFPCRHQRLDPALLPAAIDDRAFDRFDRHRVVVDVQGARGLARRGADAAGELRKVVRGVQHFQRIAPAVAPHQLVPVGDQVIDRAAAVAERDAAIHAARALLRHLGRRQREDELLPRLETRLDLLVRPLLAFDLEEAGDQTHDHSAATAFAVALSRACRSARL